MATRSVLAGSLLLGIAGFVVALYALPVEERPVREQRERVRSIPTLDQAVERIRSAMTGARPDRAFNVAARAAELYPREPEAWLWKVITAHDMGSLSEAHAAGEELRAPVEAVEPPVSPIARARRAYRLGWALTGLGDHQAARLHFLDAADFYTQGGEEVAGRPLWFFNLACYLAMGGEHDRAAEAFAQAVDAGYSDGNGWWRVDPDLHPVRRHPVFLRAVAAMAEREAAEGAEQGEPVGETPVQDPDPDAIPAD